MQKQKDTTNKMTVMLACHHHHHQQQQQQACVDLQTLYQSLDVVHHYTHSNVSWC